jgi:hypothetical protein
MTMELRCPDCASPEVIPDPDGTADDRLCGNCGAGFARDSCLVTVAEAESEAAIHVCAPVRSAAPHRFGIDVEKARAQVIDPDGDLWPVNAFSDADEVHSLVATALELGVISHADPVASLGIYPMALAEPDPLLAVGLSGQPTLLGHSLRLQDREGEDPVAFTLRLLEEVVAEANELLGALSPCRCGYAR